VVSSGVLRERDRWKEKAREPWGHLPLDQRIPRKKKRDALKVLQPHHEAGAPANPVCSRLGSEGATKKSRNRAERERLEEGSRLNLKITPHGFEEYPSHQGRGRGWGAGVP